MATVTFDTLKFVEKLRAAGVSEPQAKAQAEVLIFALAEVMDQQLATKVDIAILDRGVKAEFKEVRSDIAKLEREVKADIAKLEREQIVPMQRDLYVIKWMMGMVLAGIVAIILKTYFPA